MKQLNFMGVRKLAVVLSVALLLASIASMAVRGLNFGLDFTGGSLVEVGYEDAADLNDIRERLTNSGFKDVTVQTFGAQSDVLIRLGADHDPKLGEKVLASLQDGESQQLELRRNEFVGAQVGEELREQGGLGMLVALMMIMLYVAFRFQFKFSVGAVVALAHDVIIVLGAFSFTQMEFDLTVLAAILAVIGYSLNDTIVVSDHIRENFRKLRETAPADVINTAINQTLGRTLITSLTTLLVLITLALVGGEMIHGFAMALLIGVVVGTYSSIYVSANVLLAMNIDREDLIPTVKEPTEEDLRP